MPRIILVHPYFPSAAPMEAAFARLWPEAQRLSLLDESLYADVTADGVMAPNVHERIATLLRHAVASGAEAIVFTGSTFGPAVDVAREGLQVPALKADEAMAVEAAQRGGSVLLVCTAARALPVLQANLQAAALLTGGVVKLATLVVPQAKAALVAGDGLEHDRLIAAAIMDQPMPDVLLLGQMSMGNVLAYLPDAYLKATITAPDATVRLLRGMFSSKLDRMTPRIHSGIHG